MTLKKLAIPGLLIAAALWWFFGGGAANDNAARSNAVQVSVAKAVSRDIPKQLALVGTVVAYETVAVKPRMDSQVTAVAFRDGDKVQEGQLLFELDDRAIKAQIQELEANLAKDKAQLVNSKLQYERALKLAKSNTVSQARVDETRAAYLAQAAQVGATQASLDNNNVLLSYTRIAAPISGRAGTINVTRGNNVMEGNAQPLVTINQVMPIRVQFAIPQRHYDPVKTAMAQGSLPVVAKRGESDAVSSGTLEYLDNAIDTGNGTFAARAVFSNEDEMLWPGMFVNVILELGTEKMR
jgi:multidrug efflux system membrane fusion protein